MTHAELVTRAAAWLRNHGHPTTWGEYSTRVRLLKCNVIMTETGSWFTRIPDAIGWHFEGASISIECKTSRSDFHADKGKKRPPIGLYRYYMAPTGLLSVADIPEPYGLIDVRARNSRLIKPAVPDQAYDPKIEVPLLVAEMRRVAVAGNRARLWVDPDLDVPEELSSDNPDRTC